MWSLFCEVFDYDIGVEGVRIRPEATTSFRKTSSAIVVVAAAARENAERICALVVSTGVLKLATGCRARKVSGIRTRSSEWLWNVIVRNGVDGREWFLDAVDTLGVVGSTRELHGGV